MGHVAGHAPRCLSQAARPLRAKESISPICSILRALRKQSEQRSPAFTPKPDEPRCRATRKAGHGDAPRAGLPFGARRASLRASRRREAIRCVSDSLAESEGFAARRGSYNRAGESARRIGLLPRQSRRRAPHRVSASLRRQLPPGRPPPAAGNRPSEGRALIRVRCCASRPESGGATAAAATAASENARRRRAGGGPRRALFRGACGGRAGSGPAAENPAGLRRRHFVAGLRLGP